VSLFVWEDRLQTQELQVDEVTTDHRELPPEMQPVSIPASLRTTPISSLRLPNFLTRTLTDEGFRQLGDLEGIDFETLALMPGVSSVLRVSILKAAFAYVREHSSDKPTRLVKDYSSTSDTVIPCAPDPMSERLHFPELLSRTPLEAIPIPPRGIQVLLGRGFRTLGQINGLSTNDLLSMEGMGKQTITAIRVLSAELRNLDLSRLAAVTRDASPTSVIFPGIGLPVLHALFKATTLEDEVRALTAGLSPRDANFFTQRIGLDRWPPPTLEDIGDEYGLTRERVRQLTRSHERQLECSGLRLPIASRIGEIIRQMKIASTDDVLAQLEHSGLGDCANSSTLRVLPALADLHLIDPVGYREPLDLWFGGAVLQPELEEGLEQLVRMLSRGIARELSMVSAVLETDLQSVSPLVSPELLSRLMKRRANQVLRTNGYLIPIPIRESRLVRAVLKMLAVTPVLSVLEVYSGIRRIQIRRPPPIEVLVEILHHVPFCRIEGGSVHAEVPIDPQSVLSPADLVAIEALRAHGGAMLWSDFVDAIIAGGFTIPTALVLTRKPFIRSPSTAVYQLRGFPVTNDTLIRLRESRRRRDRETRTVLSRRWVGPDQLEVRLLLTRFALAGVLASPREISKDRHEWKARFSNGKSGRLKVRNGFIWSFAGWFRSTGAREGDVVVALYDRARGIAEFDLLHQDANDRDHRGE
jgi:hypothetical protein